jgi:uncharacterized membrane protein
MLSVLLVLLTTTRANPSGSDACFLVPDQPSAVRFLIGRRPTDESIAYTVRDTWGAEVSTGRASADGNVLIARLTLPRGFYEIEFPAISLCSGLVVLPPHAGPVDPFFGIDSALSWLVRRDEVRAGLLQGLARSGMAISRERLSWGAINPAADRWEWQTDRHYEWVRRECARRQLRVIEMFHDRAGWAGGVGRYPEDLPATARAWRQIAGRWQATWGALEVWNEPDIFFGGLLPADQYVPLAKTLAYVREQAGPGPAGWPLVGGAFATCNRRYLDASAANGLLECVEAISFHTYDRAPRMESLVTGYREWLAAHGREDMPLWITECGRPWKRGPDRPSVDQDVQSALDITMKGVEARACGVAVYCPFVYPFYEENESNFGMTDRQGSPLRSMAAYAQLILALRHKRYLGDLRVDDPAIRRARVFGDGHEMVAVLYTGEPRAKAAMKLGLRARRIEGLDGRVLNASDPTAVPVPDGLSYVWLDRAEASSRLRTDTAAMRLWKIGQQTPQPTARPSPLVLRFQYDPHLVRPTVDGYGLPAESPATLPIVVRVFNLDAQAQDLLLTLTLATDDRRTIDVQSHPAKIPAQGFADLTWTVDLHKALAQSDRLRAVVTAAGQAAPLAIDFMGEPALEQVLGRYRRPIRLPIQESKRWQPGIAGGGHMTLDPEADGSCRLRATFGPGDRWVYPQFTLPERVGLHNAAGLVVRIRCPQPAEVRVMLFKDNGAGYMTPGSIVPADGQWHAASIRFSELVYCGATATDTEGKLDLDHVRRISIGMNTKAAQATLEFRDLHVLASD